MVSLEEKNKLRWILLREFTKHLILNSKKEQIKAPPKEIPKLVPSQARYEIKPEIMMASPKTRFTENVFPNKIRKENYPTNVKPQEGMLDLGKLNILIGDPRVKEIDCYGPNKEMLVKIGNGTQKTRVTLTQEEINKVMKDFSERTRIPLLKGIFKAALGNLIITAFISDFVETKFTIQKRTPFEPLIRNKKPNY